MRSLEVRVGAGGALKWALTLSHSPRLASKTLLKLLKESSLPALKCFFLNWKRLSHSVQIIHAYSSCACRGSNSFTEGV